MAKNRTFRALLLFLAASAALLLSCSANDGPTAVSVGGGGGLSSSKPGDGGEIPGPGTPAGTLEASRPSSARNALTGAPLEEFYFVWYYTAFLHPYGPDLGDWWRYGSIPEVLSDVRAVGASEGFLDPFSRYLDSAQAHAYWTADEATVDTTVFVERLDDEVALVQISSFRRHSVGRESGDTAGTWSEFLDALDATASDRATILDLRGNPGGDYAACMGVADEILGAQPFFVLWRGWSRLNADVPEYTTVVGADGGRGEGRRWVVLQDSGSASCAELVATSVQSAADPKIPVVGTRSYGKGIGQSLLDGPHGGMLSVTSMVIFSAADGRTYHGVGIEPDTLVSDPDEQLAAAYALARAPAGSSAADSSAAALPDSSAARPAPPPAPDFAGLQRRLVARRSASAPEMTIPGPGLRKAR